MTIEIPEEIARRVLPVAYAYPDVFNRLVDWYASDDIYYRFYGMLSRAGDLTWLEGQRDTLDAIINRKPMLDWYVGVAYRVDDLLDMKKDLDWLVSNRDTFAVIVDYRDSLDWVKNNQPPLQALVYEKREIDRLIAAYSGLMELYDNRAVLMGHLREVGNPHQTSATHLGLGDYVGWRDTLGWYVASAESISALPNRTATLEVRVVELTANLVGQSNNLATLTSRLNDLAGQDGNRLVWLGERQASIQNLITFMSDARRANIDYVSTLTSRVSSAETTLLDVSGFLSSPRRSNIDYIPALTSRLGTAESNISSLGSGLNSLSSRISSDEAALSTLTSRFNDLAGQDGNRLTWLGERQAPIQNLITFMSDARRANIDYVPTLTSRVGSVESWLTDTRRSYVDYVPTLNTRLGNAEAALSDVSTLLGSLKSSFDALAAKDGTKFDWLTSSKMTSIDNVLAIDFTKFLTSVPDLNASKITVGILSVDRIPDLSTKYLTSIPTRITDAVSWLVDAPTGWSQNRQYYINQVLAIDFSKFLTSVPDLDAAKITGGILSIDRIPTTIKNPINWLTVVPTGWAQNRQTYLDSLVSDLGGYGGLLKTFASDPTKYIADRLSTSLKTLESNLPNIEYVSWGDGRWYLGRISENYGPLSMLWGSIDTSAKRFGIDTLWTNILDFGNGITLDRNWTAWLQTIGGNIFNATSLFNNIDFTEMRFDYWIGPVNVKQSKNYGTGADALRDWWNDCRRWLAGVRVTGDESAPVVDGVTMLSLGVRVLLQGMMKAVGIELF